MFWIVVSYIQGTMTNNIKPSTPFGVLGYRHWVHGCWLVNYFREHHNIYYHLFRHEGQFLDDIQGVNCPDCKAIAIDKGVLHNPNRIHKDCIYYSGDPRLKCAVNPDLPCLQCSDYIRDLDKQE